MSRSYKNFQRDESLEHYYRSERRKSRMKHQESDQDKALAAEYTRYLDSSYWEEYGLGHDSGYYSKD